MKIKALRFAFFSLVVFMSVSTGVIAQVDQRRLPEREARILSRGANWNSVEWYDPRTNEDGSVWIYTNKYTQLESGLNRLVNGEWAPASDRIEIVGGRAVARGGQHQVKFAASPDEAVSELPGAIEVTLPDGKILNMRVLGLAFYDTKSKQRVFLAGIKSSEGEVSAAGTEVIYRDCFEGEGIRASLYYINGKWGLEQNVVLESQVPSPADWGLDPQATRLGVLTEAFDAPAPSVRKRDSADDSDLDFGSMRMGHGKAFLIGNDDDATPVMKQWQLLDQRRFLIEEIEYQQLEPRIKQLPPAQQDGVIAPARLKSNRKALPPIRRASKPSGGMKVAKAEGISSGYLIDYTLINSSQNNYTFTGGGTFFISGLISLTGTTVLEPAIVKFAPGASLVFSGAVSCLSTSYCPLVCTARDDDSVGDVVSGSSGLPSGYYAATALNFSGISGALTLQSVRVRFAQTAVSLPGSTGHVMSHMQFVACQNGVTGGSGTDYKLYNALFWNVGTCFTGTGTGHLAHVTVDASTLFNGGQTIYAVNSLFTAVSGWGSSYVPDSTVVALASSQGVYQQVKAGAHYLAPGSPYRNMGNAPIDSALQAELKKRTTYAPGVLGGAIGSSMVLNAVVQRDTDTPDLGYHPEALDYLVTNVTVSSVLVLSNSVAIGVLGPVGLNIASGGSLNSMGSPLSLNRFVSYAYVQEQPTNIVGTTFCTESAGSAIFRFSDFSVPFGVRPSVANSQCQLSFRDCQSHGASFDIATSSSVSFINNLFERCGIYVSTNYSSPSGFSFHNNLVRGGIITIVMQNGGGIQNNLFDGAIASFYPNWGSPYVNKNAFTVGTYDNLGSGSILNVTANYQAGPLGRYYYPSTGGGLSALLNAGSGAAGNFGLYHHTLRADQTRELSSNVGVGFHYIALNNGALYDTDGEGLPDYFEDTDGNGTYNSTYDMCNWQNADTDSDGLSDYTEWIQGLDPKSTTTQTDTAGIVGLDVYTLLK